MTYVKTIELNTWRDYVELHKDVDLSPDIFRGQSNMINSSGKFTKWGLESSFNRYYTKQFSFQFKKMLNQQFEKELFKNKYGGYSYRDIDHLASLNALQKWYHLQHYGIPTCLIDFTFEPLVALYFAMTSIQGTSSLKYDENGNCIHFSNDADRDYVSIYKLNYNILNVYFSTKEINNENFDGWLSSYKIQYTNITADNIKIGLILKPEEDLKGIANYNLSAQKGCFLLFDNEEGFDRAKGAMCKVDFEDFLKKHEQHFELKLPEPVLTVW